MKRLRAFFRRWSSLWVALGLFGLAAAVNFAIYNTGRGKPIPLLAAAPWTIAIPAVVALVISIGSALDRNPRLLPRVGLIVLHIVLALAGALGVLATEGGFPFTHNYEQSIGLPDDRGTAYLYRGGLFCRRTVWITPEGQWWSRRSTAEYDLSCEGEARLSWDADAQKVRVTTPGGGPVPPTANWGLSLDLFPH